MGSSIKPIRRLRRAPKVTPIRGTAVPGGGRAAFVPVPLEFQATTKQMCGLYPWSAPGTLPLVGTPIGLHQTAPHEVVCFDHISWFEAKLIANPSALIIGRPGTGKSTMASRMMLGAAAAGHTLLTPGDTKPDYVELTRKLGGEVRTTQRTGGAALNPCDPGGMVAAGRRIAAVKGRELEGEAIIGEAVGRATTLIGGLLELSRKATVHDYEEAVISTSLTHLYAESAGVPLIPHLIRYIESAPYELRQDLFVGGTLPRTAHHRVAGGRRDTGAGAESEYDRLTKPLLRSLHALISGKFGDVFSRPTTRSEGAPALDIDTSRIKAGDPAFLGAVLMAAWADVYGMVEAEQALADAGLQPRRLYSLTLDELWRVLMLGGSLPERVNELTRLNRTQGVGQLMITHSVRIDLGSSGTATDGLAERAGAILIGGIPKKEIAALDELMTLTSEEQAALQAWWSMSQGLTGDVPPGVGKFLLKPSGDDPGIPLDVILSSVEREWGGQNTNKAWDRGEASA